MPAVGAIGLDLRYASLYQRYAVVVPAQHRQCGKAVDDMDNYLFVRFRIHGDKTL